MQIWSCKLRTCRHCGYHKLIREIGHFGHLMLQQPTIFITERIPDTRWEAIKKQISRKGGEYVRLPQPDGTLTLIHTRRLYRSDREWEDFRDLNSNHAEFVWLTLPMALTNAYKTPDKKISTSDAWAITRARQQMKHLWPTSSDPSEEGWVLATHPRGANYVLATAIDRGLLPSSTRDRPLTGVFEIDGNSRAKNFDEWISECQIQTLDELRSDQADMEGRLPWTPNLSSDAHPARRSAA